jgi:hypothetical protein
MYSSATGTSPPRKGDDLLDALHAGERGDESLHTHAPSTVRGSSPFPELLVPGVLIGREASGAHGHVEGLGPLLADAPTHELAHSGDEEVEAGDGPSIGVDAHVEGFLLLGVVGDEDRPSDMLLGEEALVLALDPGAPGGGIDKGLDGVGLFEDGDGLGVGEAEVGALGETVEAGKECRIHPAVQEMEVLWAFVEDGKGSRLDALPTGIEEPLGDIVGGEIPDKGHLRLQHPELREMPRSAGGFSTEGRAKGVDTADGQGHGLEMELARDGEVDGLPEEGLFSLGPDLEGFAPALTIMGGEHRHGNLSVLLGVEVGPEGAEGGIADAQDRSARVGAWTEVGHLPEVLPTLMLLLQRVCLRSELVSGGRGGNVRDIMAGTHLLLTWTEDR